VVTRMRVVNRHPCLGVFFFANTLGHWHLNRSSCILHFVLCGRYSY
jgi:hypothetical protein